MENIRGLVGLSLFLNPARRLFFEEYLSKLSDEQKLLLVTVEPKTQTLTV